MLVSRRVFTFILTIALVTGVGLTSAGCGGNETVSKYTVPTADYRMLAGMFPADNPQWFFKYSGPADVVGKYEGDFDKLLASVKLNGTAPPEFTPPEGWQRGPGRDGFVKVYATVKTADDKQEITITQSAGGVEQNLSRWVKQIGLKPGSDDVAKYTKPVGTNGLRVDLTGPDNPTTNRGPMMGGKQ